MKTKNIAFMIMWFVIIVGLVTTVTIFSENYILGLFIVILGLLILVFYFFESGEIVIDKLVLIGILSSLSSVGRIILSSIPSVQPSSFIIMLSGIGFGKEIGMMVGVITALSSNLVLGQGPWTPWQMFLWGLMGYLSGVLSKFLRKNKVFFIIYGFIWGFAFGWIMNLWAITGYYSEISREIFIVSCISSFYFDLAHSLSNVILIKLSGDRFNKVLKRLKEKYTQSI